MKPKFITSLILFVSAYAPLFLILAIKDFDFEKTFNFKHIKSISILLTLSFISIILLFVLINKLDKGNMVVKVVSVKSRSIDLINYTIPYIVSFFGFNLDKVEDVVSLSIFLLLMFIMTLKSKSIFMNPVLLLNGYNLYDLEYEFDGKNNSTIIISKDDLTIGKMFYVRSLTKFLYITKNEKRY